MSKKSIIRAAFSFCLVLLILMQMDLKLLERTTTEIRSGVFLAAIIMLIVQIIFLSLRWHAYINVGKAKIPFRTSLFINIAGYLANILFIASVGGILAKSGLAVRHGVTIVNAVFATMLDRFMTLASLIFFSILGLPFLIGVIDSKILFMLGASITFLVLIVIASLILLNSGLLRDYILSSRRRSRVIIALRNYTQDVQLMKVTSIYSLLGQASFIFAVYILSLGIDGHHANTIEFLALMPILALISSLPISFGGWGVREGVFVYGLGLIGFSMENAFLLSIQVGLASMIAPFIVGLPYLLCDDFRHYLSGENSSLLKNPARLPGQLFFNFLGSLFIK